MFPQEWHPGNSQIRREEDIIDSHSLADLVPWPLQVFFLPLVHPADCPEAQVYRLQQGALCSLASPRVWQMGTLGRRQELVGEESGTWGFILLASSSEELLSLLRPSPDSH